MFLSFFKGLVHIVPFILYLLLFAYCFVKAVIAETPETPGAETWESDLEDCAQAQVHRETVLWQRRGRAAFYHKVQRVVRYRFFVALLTLSSIFFSAFVKTLREQHALVVDRYPCSNCTVERFGDVSRKYTRSRCATSGCCIEQTGLGLFFSGHVFCTDDIFPPEFPSTPWACLTLFLSCFWFALMLLKDADLRNKISLCTYLTERALAVTGKQHVHGCHSSQSTNILICICAITFVAGMTLFYFGMTRLHFNIAVPETFVCRGSCIERWRVVELVLCWSMFAIVLLTSSLIQYLALKRLAQQVEDRYRIEYNMAMRKLFDLWNDKQRARLNPLIVQMQLVGTDSWYKRLRQHNVARCTCIDLAGRQLCQIDVDVASQNNKDWLQSYIVEALVAERHLIFPDAVQIFLPSDQRLIEASQQASLKELLGVSEQSLVPSYSQGENPVENVKNDNDVESADVLPALVVGPCAADVISFAPDDPEGDVEGDIAAGDANTKRGSFRRSSSSASEHDVLCNDAVEGTLVARSDPEGTIEVIGLDDIADLFTTAKQLR